MLIVQKHRKMTRMIVVVHACVCACVCVCVCVCRYPQTYVVPAVCVHTAAVEQQLKEGQVPLPGRPKHSISQGRLLLGDISNR